MIKNEQFQHLFLHVRKKTLFKKFVAVIFSTDFESLFNKINYAAPNVETTDTINDLLNVGFIRSNRSADMSLIFWRKLSRKHVRSAY